MNSIRRITNTEDETIALGREFAGYLKPGDVVLFYGDLGTGKTTFVKGVAEGLGITTRVISPTFVLQRSHMIPDLQKSLVHIDLYRLESEHVQSLGIDEVVHEGNIVLIEWAQRLRILPKKRWEIYCKYRGDDTREIEIKQTN